ncbi:hypothetical protein C0216_01060 [Streptomyces globosus]|uniref:Uncharacterized protein n=1 Tax=Streptomyces globosus TaxID=68209 RepID=A0A344TU96_9ACTN|nr:hypothetical protein [Streptomyces globosus]AXE22217.1 hypothetical protein C0216_01060 [Streptomyces globosus]
MPSQGALPDVIAESFLYHSILGNLQGPHGGSSLTAPRPPALVARIPGVGDAWANARSLLRRRVDEAHDVVDAVLAEAPAVFPDVPPAPADRRSLEEHARTLLRTYLDPFMALVFNGEQSVRFAVSGKRLKKVARRLHDALEECAAAFEPAERLAGALAEEYPHFLPDTYDGVSAALLVLAAWDASHRHPTRELTESLLRSVERDGRIRLGLFVCPPVDFTRLHGERPELYVRDHMHGSVLSRLAGRLRELFRGLEGAQVEVELRAIVGDTDEDDYLWYGVPAPAHLDRVALDARREALVTTVANYLTEEVSAPRGGQPRIFRGTALTVQRLSAMAPSAESRNVYAAVLANPLAYFDRRDVEAEKGIMRGLWEPGSYYEGLSQPDDATLADIVVRKFATYAMQGRMLHELDPDMVLVQTERPPLLRARMLNAGWDQTGRSPLPTVEFFEPEDG